MSDGSYDVIVVGCGGAGSATTWWLARNGARVLAIDRFEARHTRGSSHGTERIFRLASPDPVYVRLAQEALPMWKELDATNGGSILRSVGGVDTGDDREIDRIASECEAEGVRYEWLDAGTATRRFPGLAFRGRALAQADAGCVNAQAAVEAFAREAVAHGAAIHRSERVVAIEQHGNGVDVTTARDTYHAAAAVITTGAWAQAMPADLVAFGQGVHVGLRH